MIKNTPLTSGGNLSRVLSELEESGFLSSFQRFGLKKTHLVYFISDFYTLFYFRFIEQAGKYEPNMWLSTTDSPVFRAWSGLSFEQVCFAHVPQIKKALGISGVASSTSTWRIQGSAEQKGSQIDLVIDRRDQVINLFEIKFSIDKFAITKDYDAALRHKIQAFREATGTRKSVFLTMITTHGLKDNEYRYSVVQNELTMDILFTAP
ncbi:MAG: hypothetical protein L6Q97_09945 [Thermoanaerobaculia bacterium]|nr:hypothetical protein [Thermoanaerobaculia bacterium]